MSTRLASLALLAGIPLTVAVATWTRAAPPVDSGVAAGRQVYVAEGCIHCHSQFIRPGSIDEELWGAPRDPEFSRTQTPALIGNRRQGPDLMNVGLRRPREWQRRHLADPRSVVPESRMPAYGHLFAPDATRGEALLDYLDSLGREPAAPPAGAIATAGPAGQSRGPTRP